jgi:hypothetical protein
MSKCRICDGVGSHGQPPIEPCSECGGSGRIPRCDWPECNCYHAQGPQACRWAKGVGVEYYPPGVDKPFTTMTATVALTDPDPVRVDDQVARDLESLIRTLIKAHNAYMKSGERDYDTEFMQGVYRKVRKEFVDYFHAAVQYRVEMIDIARMSERPDVDYSGWGVWVEQQEAKQATEGQ